MIFDFCLSHRPATCDKNNRKFLAQHIQYVNHIVIWRTKTIIVRCCKLLANNTVNITINRRYFFHIFTTVLDAYAQCGAFTILGVTAVIVGFRCPTTVVDHYLRVPSVLPFLLLWQFRVHDGHMHLFQLESNDQQSSFR